MELDGKRFEEALPDNTRTDGGDPPEKGPEDQPFYVKWAQAIVLFAREDIGKAANTWRKLKQGESLSDGPNGLDAKFEAVVDSMLGEGPVNDKLRDELRELKALPWPVDILSVYIVWLRLKATRLQAWLSGVINIQTQDINQDLTPNVIDAGTLARFAQYYPGAESQVNSWLDRLGIPAEQQTFLKGAMRRWPDVVEILQMRNRKIIDDFDAQRIFSAHGFTEGDTNDLLELRHWYPSPTDWASLAGREAFEEDQIAAFELDKGFDQIDPATYERAGMTAETARWQWVAHWSNVSPQQLFEMIHRKAPKPGGGVFTTDDVDSYVRLADINPFFGDALEHIAFRPLTRVDVRRMRADGILEYKGVWDSYIELGYNEANATLMADWTEKYVARGERQLTRTQIEKMFELRQIKRAEMATMLEMIGYDTIEAETISLLNDAKLEEQRLRSFIRRTEYEYKRRMITKEGASSRLIDEDVQGDLIGELVEEWDNELVYEQALPSKDDLEGFRALPDFSDERFREGMRALRYTDANIDLYLSGGEAKLSKTDLLRLFDQEEITEERAQGGLLGLGYSRGDTTALLRPIMKRIDRRHKREQAEALSD